MSSLKQLALKGTAWSLLGYGASQLIRLGSNIFLTRLLAPELFGLMAIALTFLIALNLFSDVGLGPSVIQHRRGDEPVFLNTVWTLQIIRGIGLWIGCLLISWPLAQLYADDRLLWLLPVLGLTCVLDGFNSTSLLTLNRQFALQKLTLLELLVQVISLTVMLVWAWLSPTLWALVAGNLLGSSLKMFFSHRLVPDYSNHLAWEPEALQDILSFGKWIFISTAFTFLATQSDRLFLAKLTSFEILGIYTIASTLALFPQAIISSVSNRVLLPVYSRLCDLPRETLRLKMLKNRQLLLLAMCFLVVLLVCFGDWLILLLYDSRYEQASWMLPILALGIWPNVLFEINRHALIALGKANYQAYGQILKSIHMCLGLIIGYYLFGLPGFIIVVALNDLELYGIVTYGLWREKLSCFQQDIFMTLVVILLITVVLTIRYLLGGGLPIDLMLSNPAAIR